VATVSLRDLVIRYISGLDTLDGRYRNLSPISPIGGNGTFSIVFSATDENLGIPVILKFFDPGYDADHSRREYFKREAEALLHLNDQRRIRHLVDIVQGHTVHLGALPVSTDTAVAHALEYYVMKPYPKTLEDYIYKEQHDLGDCLLTFREVVAGVHCAHRFEYCHRDLKPNNVLMGRDRYVAVSDFGSAKRLATLAARELEDYEPTPAGHYQYTSPELLAGLTTVEHFYSTDLFALGLILFEMLKGMSQ
jgi:serine/threonine protein kinase